MTTSGVAGAEDLAFDDLGPLGPVLGRGGQAVVYELPNPDPAGPRLVYKEYRPGQAPDPHGMRRLIGLRNGLDDARRATLDSITAWPLQLVMEAGGVRGVVLPRIPASYFQDTVLPSGKPKAMVREVQHMFVPDERCRRIGMPVATTDQRYEVLRDFAAALTFLHEVEVVFGDINARNLLFRLAEQPMTMLVDCDAVRLRGMVGRKLLNAPDWEPPGRPVLSRETDLYKYALLVLRLLTPGAQASTRTDPADAVTVLDTEGMALLTAALRDHPGNPPTAAEWFRYLTTTLGYSTEPPVLDEVEFDRTMVAASEPVRMRWAGRHIATLEVTGPGIAPVVLDGKAGDGVVEVRPAHTTRLTLRARNTFGELLFTTRPVAVVDIPRFDDLPVPMPRLEPDLGFARLPDVGLVLLCPSLACPPGPCFAAVQSVMPPPVLAPSADLPILASLTGVLRGLRGRAANTPTAPPIDTDGAETPVDIVSIMSAAPDLDVLPNRGAPIR